MGSRRTNDYYMSETCGKSWREKKNSTWLYNDVLPLFH